MIFHAPLLVREMRGGIMFHKFKEAKHFGVGIQTSGEALQPVDVGDQHLVLRVNQRVAGFKLFTPEQHNFDCLNPTQLIKQLWISWNNSLFSHDNDRPISFFKTKRAIAFCTAFCTAGAFQPGLRATISTAARFFAMWLAGRKPRQNTFG